MWKSIRKIIREAIEETGLFLDQDEINEILKGYLEAALWTEEERLGQDVEDMNRIISNHNEEDEMSELDKLLMIADRLNKNTIEEFTVEDIDPDSLIQTYLDIKKFISEAGEEACQEAINENGLERLGHDIWLTRNHHGAGFLDHWYDNEDILDGAAKKIGSTDLYIGDDMKLHFS